MIAPAVRRRSLLSSTLALSLGLATFAVAAGGPPPGWGAAGSRPQDYEMTVDPSTRLHGKPSAVIRSKAPSPDGFGTLMQEVSADEYRRKRLRFAADVKASDVSEWAGLWMRVDGRPKQTLAFDNMHERPIKGTADWRRYEVVLDVTDDATLIAFGILLQGSGTVWMSGVKLEEVGPDVPVTGGAASRQRSDRPRGPQNLELAD
jgi:hypothetical protein